MNDTRGGLTLGGVFYPMAFNLNVMETIQREYGSISHWGEVTEGTDDGVDAGAVKFGILAMINEGLDMENETAEEPRALLTAKQLGRLLTAETLKEAGAAMRSLVVESTTDPDDDSAKNA